MKTTDVESLFSSSANNYNSVENTCKICEKELVFDHVKYILGEGSETLNMTKFQTKD